MSGAVAQAQDAEASLPGAPTNLHVADYSNPNVDILKWTAPDSDGGADITTYQLQWQRAHEDHRQNPRNTGSTNPQVTFTKGGRENWGYLYRVRAVNSAGPGAWSNEIRVGGRPSWKSGAAGIPTATAHATLPQVTLDWAGKLNRDGGSPIEGYTWRYKEADSNGFITGERVDADTTSVVVTDLEHNTAYDFDVIAHNEHRSSYTSGDARATTVGAPGTPGAPTALKVTDTSQDLQDKLAWTAPTDSGDSAITGYQLRRRASNSDSWETPANTGSTATTYTSNKDVEPQNGYSYRVRAVNTQGPGAWSNEIRVGGKPAWKSGAAGTPWATPHATALEVRVGWNGRLRHNGGSPITRWTLRIKKASEDNFRTYWTATTNGNNFPDVQVAYTLAWNTSYDFHVIVENAHRKSSSADVRVTTAHHPDRPGAPADLRVTDVSDVNRDSLVWTAPTDAGASAITGYQLERRVTTSDEWETTINTGSTATTYTSNKAGWGYGYFYRVRAVNSTGTGPWSNEIRVGGRPTWKSGAEGTPTATPHANRPEVTLDWAEKLNHDGGKPVTKWRWRMKKASSNDFVWKDELPAGQTSVTATGLEYNTAYDFDVVAYNADRGSFTSPDARATTSHHPGPPGAPTNLRVTDTSQAMQDKLEWTAPPSNGAAVTTYQVQRRESQVDYWGEDPVNTDSTDTAYTVTKAWSGFGYFYRVQAVNSGGPGAWSEEIKVGGLSHWKSGAAGTPTATPHARLPQITLDWTGRLAHNGGKRTTKWTVRYKKASSDDFKEVGDFAASITNTIVGDLEYDTAYDFDVIASNGDRRSPASAAARATTASPDHASLTAFYNATGGANWGTNTNWLSEEPLHRWAGVATDDDGRVIALDLPNNNLQGSLPAEISNLSKLQQIHVHNNEGLRGSLPLSMAGMSSMKRLVANSTGLCAPDDDELREWLDSLEKAVVQECSDDRDRAVLMEFYNATGGENWTYSQNWGSDKPLHEWSGVWTNPLGRVTELNLTGNELEGSIPASFGNLTELRHIYLNGNELTGALPESFGNLSKLEHATLSDNKITGPLPAGLGSLANLEKLYLQNNLLTGQLPNTLDGMEKLRILYLNNQEDKDGNGGLTGQIPASVGSMPSLEELVLDRNNLTGLIPTELGNSTSLRRIAANRNRITGAIPAELGNMPRLHTLGLARNDLSGTLPSELGNLAQLQRLSLHDNEELSGPVPASFGGLSKLYRLAISNTGMSGTLPSTMTNMGAMNQLFFDGTGLCAPTDDAFQGWFGGIRWKSGDNCQ